MEISSLHSQEGQNFAAQNDPESPRKFQKNRKKRKRDFRN